MEEKAKKIGKVIASVGLVTVQYVKESVLANGYENDPLFGKTQGSTRSVTSSQTTKIGETTRGCLSRSGEGF